MLPFDSSTLGRDSVLGILAVALGVVAGLLGCAPYLLVDRRIRAKAGNQGARSILLGFLGVAVSTVVMAVLIVAIRFLMPEQVLLFAMVCIGSFLVCMIIYVVSLFRGQKQ
jgi:drug/metabolite transporter (DMT)-like permease